MPIFDSTNKNNLKEYLTVINTHDARFARFDFQKKENTLFIQTTNPVWGGQLSFEFQKVSAIHFTAGAEIGDPDEIIGVTIEDSCPSAKTVPENTLCLLFELFSGDEIYIVSKRIVIQQAD